MTRCERSVPRSRELKKEKRGEREARVDSPVDHTSWCCFLLDQTYDLDKRGSGYNLSSRVVRAIELRVSARFEGRLGVLTMTSVVFGVRSFSNAS